MNQILLISLLGFIWGIIVPAVTLFVFFYLLGRKAINEEIRQAQEADRKKTGAKTKAGGDYPSQGSQPYQQYPVKPGNPYQTGA